MKSQEVIISANNVNQVIELSARDDLSAGYQCVWLPAYMRVKIKKINQLDIGSLNGNLNVLILLTVYYGGRSDLVEDIKEKLSINILDRTVKLSNPESESIYKRGSKSFRESIFKKIEEPQNGLTKSKDDAQKIILRHDIQEKTLNYFVYLSVNVRMEPRVIFTPLEYINTKLEITVNNFYVKQYEQSIQASTRLDTINQQKAEREDSMKEKRDQSSQNQSENLVLTVTSVKINLMDCDQKSLKLYYDEDVTLGDYDLAENNLSVVYHDSMTRQSIYTYFYGIQYDHKQQEMQRIVQDIKKIQNKQERKRKLLSKASLSLFDQPRKLQKGNSKNLNDVNDQTLKQHFSILQKNDYTQERKRALRYKSLRQNARISRGQKHKIEKVYDQMPEEQLIMSLIQLIQNQNIATIYIPFYKHPLATMITLLIPFVVLGLFNLGVFFEDNSMFFRIASLGGILMAFNAFLPAFRSNIPAIPKVTLLEILIILQILTCFLTAVQSLTVRDIKDYVFNWRQDGFFLASLIVTLMNVTVILIMALIYFCYLRFKYNLRQDAKYQKTFVREDWFNEKCAISLNKYQKLSQLKINFTEGDINPKLTRTEAKYQQQQLSTQNILKEQNY